MDRKLFEEIGDPSYTQIMDFEKIKNLVKEGAKMDHWVEHGASRYNAIQLASRNKSDKNDGIISFFYQKSSILSQRKKDMSLRHLCLVKHKDRRN